jgi:DNA-binding MarR family transcriptional regulator
LICPVSRGQTLLALRSGRFSVGVNGCTIAGQPGAGVVRGCKDAAVSRLTARQGKFDDPPLERMEQMLDQMALLVREAASAQPVLFAPEVVDAAMTESGLVDATIRSRRERAKQFPPGWFSDPAWDILLFLFRSHLRDARMTVGDVGHGTENRPTTTIRWLDIIESAGLLDRHRCTADTRRVFVFLNDRGVTAMRRYFDAVRAGAG